MWRAVLILIVHFVLHCVVVSPNSPLPCLHRYLFQIVLEAGCLEWALLIGLVLRDAMAVVRTVNTASLTDTPIEMVGRMREGLSYLELWANTEWSVSLYC